jgi:hypothetical protein
MKTSELKSNFYMFGNKGAVWSNKAHIAQSGIFSGTTLCETPMLSTNWARIEEVKEIGCPECLAKYKELTSN